MSLTLFLLQFSDSVSYKVLIPQKPVDGCPGGTSIKFLWADDFYTCRCEDHCSWDKCCLHKPPGECLSGTESIWLWDSQKFYWVAQVIQGTLN